MSAQEKIRIVTQRDAERELPPGRYSAGDNLYLMIEESGARRWLWYWRKADGKRGEKGLGSASGSKGPKVTLADARRKAGIHRGVVEQGSDPVQVERKGERFADYAKTVIEKFRPMWRNQKTAWGWQRSMRHYAKPLHDLPISTPTNELAPKIKALLEPLRRHHAETARHLRQRLEEVFREAKGAGLREGENPASRDCLGWSKVRDGKKTVKHRRPLPYEDAPALFARLDEAVIEQAALKLLMMSAARTGEILKATAGQFRTGKHTVDGRDPRWVMPETKQGKEHHVPLTADMLPLVRMLTDGLGDDDLLFPGFHDKTLLQTFRALDSDHAAIDVHGFRSTYRDWCGDETPFGREHVEASYGHAVASGVEASYRQRAAMKKRRMILSAWHAYLAGRILLQKEDADIDAMLASMFTGYRVAAEEAEPPAAKAA